MQTHDFTTLADPDDFCRSCGGKGYTEERTERGTTLSETCDQCGGHGAKTARLTKRVA